MAIILAQILAQMRSGLNLRWEAGDLAVTGLQARHTLPGLQQTPVNSKLGTGGAGVALHGAESIVRSIPRLEFFQP
jgi:hypothetical protein